MDGARCGLAALALLVGSLCPGIAHSANFSIAAGYDRSCAFDAGGNAFCWGDDESGALGDLRAILSRVPVQVVGLSTGVASIASSSSSGQTCALTNSGEALCWGSNTNGELGNGTTAPATAPAPVVALTAGTRVIATGDGATCALNGSAAVLCWGNNDHGSLGNGSIGGADTTTPSPVSGLSSGVKAITTGAGHACALTNAGGVFCWGYNNNGELGNGTTADSGIPVAVSGLASGVVAISAGGYHTCAIIASGNVVCWGYGGDGQLGNAGTASASVPVQVSGLAGVSQIAGGGLHTCAISGDSRAYCWGWNGGGQLGNGATASSSVPVAVTGLALGPTVKAFALGYAHSCALLSSGALQCWGYNGYGQLGDGTLHDSLVPVTVSGLPTGATTITAGVQHTCAVISGGSAYCWGDNSQFQLGNGQAIGLSSPNVVYGTPADVAQISTGYLHGCAVTHSGTLYCWGNDAAGQLGNGAFDANMSFASQVSLPASATAVAAGAFSTCALTTGGGVLCWGFNNYGQVGDGTTSERASPTPVSGLNAGASSIGVGYYHACALVGATGVRCWGDNDSGQLGNGTTTGTSVPVSVSGLSGATAIAVGGYHNCALSQAGGVLCWGDNANGQLGDGTKVSRTQPVAVAALSSGIQSISAGQYHTCALTSTGSVMCWGYNAYGQLGNGTTIDSSVPVQVQGLPSGVIAVAAGTYHTCALVADGTVRCWGYNSTGGLGDGSFAARLAPVVVLNWLPGSIANNNWFLDLTTSVPKAATISSAETPALLANASGNAATATVDVRATVQFRAQDVGHPIYIFGYVPASLVHGASAEKDGATCVLAQVSPSGQAQPASAANLQAYVSNVLTAAGQSLEILNQVAATNIAGATFCVGTAVTSDQAVASANSQCVATVPPISPQGETCLPPATTAAYPGALSGLWWNQNESGWGIDFTQRRNIVFAAWYTYDAVGNPKWYVASNCTMPSGTTGVTGTCSGTLYEVSGPTFFGVSFNPSLANVLTAGSLTVNFHDANNASLAYTVGTQSRTVTITRQPVGVGSTPPAVDYTDLWWNPQESGWGMAIAQQFSNMFLAWYVYDSSGKPVWYVASNCTVSGSGCSGTLYRTTGPAFGPTFNAAQVQVFTAGSVSISFSDPNNGTLSYIVNGVSASKSITRQLF